MKAPELESFSRRNRGFLFLILAFLVIGALRLNDGSLYTDSTRYVIWGTSIAQGKGFVDNTQPDPEYYVVNAPLLSVLLAPALLLFPYSVLAAKVWTLLWGVAFLIVFYAFLRRHFDNITSLGAVSVFAFNPLVLLLATEVMSEMAFLSFVMLCFLALEKLDSDSAPGSQNLIILLLITSSIVLLREVAVSLVGSLILYSLVTRRFKRALLIIAGSGILFGAWFYRNTVLFATPTTSQATNVSYIFQHFLTPQQAPLLQEISLRIASNVGNYSLHLAGMIFYPLPEMLIVEPTGLFLGYYKMMIVVKYIFPFIMVPFVLAGVWRDLRDRQTSTARILFLFSYLAIILMYPVHDVRFLLPLVPFMLFYALLGGQWLRTLLPAGKQSLMRFLGFFTLALVVLPNLICIFELERTNIRYVSDPLGFFDHLQQAGLEKNMFTKPWRILGRRIEQETPDGSVIAGALKEVSIFIGDRKLLELNNGVPVTTFEHYLRQYNVSYVMSTSSWDRFWSYEFQMGESRRFWFEQVQQVAGMKLYRVNSTFLTPRDQWLPTKRAFIDTTTAIGLLRKGRGELLRGRYEAAIVSLSEAKRLAPAQALIPYHLLVALALSGRLTEASDELQDLYRYAQAGTYTTLAAKHIAAALALEQARSAANPMQKALAMTDLASFYWNLGYYNTSYSLMKDLLAENPGYFTALLWGWHYAMQRGDSSQAHVYLRQLQGIDPSNVVVQNFGIIEQTADSLRRESNPSQRARQRLTIARAYSDVDLPQEAIDEALRALGENPRTVAAWILQAEVLERLKAPRAARDAHRHALEIDSTNALARSKLSQPED
jgi:tetratricopeptide (TPR) repeat protein/4-amino-4-deoxy-L-arabinose transferase-like glycosyltransferase